MRVHGLWAITQRFGGVLLFPGGALLLGLALAGAVGACSLARVSAVPTATPAPTPTVQELTLRLSDLVPRGDDIPQEFRLQAGAYQSNEEILAIAPDLEGTIERLLRWGRVYGYVALYAPREPSPATIQVAVDLFRTPTGAREAFAAGPLGTSEARLRPFTTPTIGEAARGFTLEDSSGQISHHLWFHYGPFLAVIISDGLGRDPEAATVQLAEDFLPRLQAALH